MDTIRKSTGAVCILTSVVILTGCCSFERDWRACSAYVHPADDLAGNWEGRWQSDENGHNGTLRAIIAKQGENEYHARFKARFAWILPYKFDIPLVVSEEAGVYSFESQADLGILAGGVYTYTGQADACDFSANFCATGGDYGTFTMRRVPCCSEDGRCGESCSEDAACCQ